MKIAVLTMFYNEPEFLPIWVKYYSGQVGAENCFVVDHGSTDESPRHAASTNLIRIPRSPQDEIKRIEAISDYASMLHRYYDAVIYTDVDEILVADPARYRTLGDFCATMKGDVAAAVGLNVHHLVGEEPAFDLANAVLLQRKWVRFVSPMCKPLISRVPVRWGRGFHSSDKPFSFGELYLFHLRSFDLPIGLGRLARTRAIARQTLKDEQAANHQRVPDEEFEGMIRVVARLPKKYDVEFSSSEEPIAGWLARAFSGGQIDYSAVANEIWQIPPRFANVF